MASKHSAHRTKPPRQRRRAPTLSDLLRESFDARGQAVTDKVAEAFGMNKTQLASTLGLSRESLYKAKRAEAEKTQARVRELLEIIVRVLPWAGGQQQAMAWYRAQPIAAFGDRTAESLVKEGKASAVRDYLDYVAQGNFA
jgi:DNA-binding phage protein